MLKKGFSILAAAVLAFPLFQVTAFAAPETKLPFTLTAPEHVAITYLDGADSLNTCKVAWSQNASMSEWASRLADPATHNTVVKEIEAMGYEDVFYTAQMDWSIDSTEDWHYNKYWDSDGCDSENVQHLGDWAYTSFLQGNDISMDAWVFRDMGNIADPNDSVWYGSHHDSDDYLGWKDVLKEGQYTIVKTDESEQHAKIDLTNHTINVRMRWLVTVRKAGEPAEGQTNEIRIGSDWSQIASVGKDAKPVASVKKGDIAAPVIRDLHYVTEEFNGHPQVAFYLDVPDATTNALINAQATGGGIFLRTEARVPNGEWVELQGDWTLKTGEMVIALQNLAEKEKTVAKDTPIELRCRYDYNPGNEGEFSTDYSNVLSIAAAAMQVTTGTAPAESTVSAANTASAAHQTPTPQKSMSWLWILLIVLAVIVLLIIIFLVVRNNKDDKKDQK